MINIRKSSYDDYDEIQKLDDQIYVDNIKYDPDIISKWGSSINGRKYFDEVLHDAESICLVIEDKGKLIGFVVARPHYFDYRKSKYLEIDNLGVLPEYQHNGLGTKLIAEVMRLGKENGYQKLIVNSYIKNTNAMSFYKQNGFVEIEVNLVRDFE